MLSKLLFIIVVVVVSIYILYKNVKADFEPSRRSMVELFCAGFVPVFLISWFMAADLTFWSRLFICTGGGIVGGIGSTYTFPRHWREIKSKLK